jgi:hypothetical protein
MRKALPYRPVALLAALALCLSAFAPAPLLPCAPTEEVPAQETMPCHGTAGETAHHDAPATPRSPARPQPDMVCCPTKAPLAPTPEQPAPVALAVAEVLGAAALLAPASQPQPVQATDASPPAPAPRHVLFGCFLT